MIPFILLQKVRSCVGNFVTFSVDVYVAGISICLISVDAHLVKNEVFFCQKFLKKSEKTLNGLSIVDCVYFEL